MNRNAAVLLATALAAGQATGALSLSVLNACEAMRTIVNKLEAGSTELRNCREPRDDLERQYTSRVLRRGMKLCILREVPSPLLARFICVKSPVITGAGIVCFRPAALSDVKAYKSSYSEAQALAEQNYLNSAAVCPVSTGDTSRSPSTMFPMFLTEVAAFQLGFVGNLRQRGEGTAVAVHGYADVDPDLNGDVPSALEYLSVHIGPKQGPAKDIAKQLGDWALTIEEDSATTNAFNDLFNKQHLDARLSSVTFRFEKEKGDRRSEEKMPFLRDINRDIVQQLREEGFRRMSAATFESHTGLKKSAMFETVRRSMPYGKRVNFSVDGDFEVLINENVRACTPGSGALGAYVLRTNGRLGIRSDYGSVDVMLLALGDCAELSSVKKYTKNLLNDVGAQLSKRLARE